MRQLSPFEIWMRTGLWPEPELEATEQKFNPWHDPEDGRFTFAGQGKFFGRGGSRDNEPEPIARPTRTLPSRADGPSPRAMRAQVERVAREGRERDGFKKLMLDAEGNRDDIYLDSEGYPTVGIGHRLPDRFRSRVGERITAAQKDAFWRADADSALRAARNQLREADITDRSFWAPLASVNFQLGGEWYKEHKNTWALIRTRRYAAAAREVQNSDWYRQTPKRVRAFRNSLPLLDQAEQARRARVRSRGASR